MNKASTPLFLRLLPSREACTGVDYVLGEVAVESVALGKSKQPSVLPGEIEQVFPEWWRLSRVWKGAL